ncbi:MAG: NAD(P)/FAD-dependent oxidoreductase [Chloroflexota bacterium]|nr:NAD(P)/FAD-dependent oxidoreductase [Chloroflexota bacterium]
MAHSDMASKIYDVLIVGAGPGGSYTAQQLAGRGYKVAVFEEHERIGEPVQCTGIIGVECFERFDLPTDCVVREANSAKLFSPSGKTIRLYRNSPQAYIVDRAAFDRHLYNEALSCGAEYFTSCRVNDIAILDDRVRITTQYKDAYEARAAVIASGFYSRLPLKLGLGRVKDFIVGAQAWVCTTADNELEEMEIYFDQKLAPGFFAWFVPTGDRSALAGLFARRRPREHLRAFIDDLYERGRIASSEADIVPGGIPLRPPKRTFGERVIVLGDAAGQVKPTTGGGVYYGMLCAEMAADVLSQAFERGDVSKQSLAGYESIWKESIGGELRRGYIARRIYEKLGNRAIDRLFDIAIKRGLQEKLARSNDISFDWHSRAVIEAAKMCITPVNRPDR